MISKVRSLERLYRADGFREMFRAIYRFWREKLTFSAEKYPFTHAKLRYYHHHLSGSPIHPFAIYSVDPQAIDTYVEYDVFGKFRNAGGIRSGDWDQNTASLQSFGKYQLITKYFNGELSAEDLTYDCLIEYGYPPSEAKTYSSMGYADYLDRLLTSIADRGVVKPEKVGLQDNIRGRYDLIALNVGRDGELIFNECGIHRLAIGRLLRISTVPVRINVIHSEWFERFGAPNSHEKLSLIDRIPIPWKQLYSLDVRFSQPDPVFSWD